MEVRSLILWVSKVLNNKLSLTTIFSVESEFDNRHSKTEINQEIHIEMNIKLGKKRWQQVLWNKWCILY